MRKPAKRVSKSFRMHVDDDVYVPMRDGVRIALRVYRPEGEGRFPALFAASPYQYETDDIPHSALFLWREVGPVPWYVRTQGYAVVHADVRGSGNSGGSYNMLDRTEQQDLYELVEWIGRQPWSNGRVGGIGQSYYAWAQWFMGILNPPSLKCIAPYDGFTDIYRDSAYHGGIYSEFLVWWYNLVRSNNLHRAANRPTGKAMERDITAELIAHQTYDDWWKERSPIEGIPEIKVPILSIGHWGKVGLHLRGNILGYERATAPKKLLVTGGRDVFEVHEMFDSIEFHERELLPFYDHYLKDAKTDYPSRAPVRLYVRGRESYSDEAEWPPANTKMVSYYLGSGPTGSVTSLNDGTLQKGGAKARAGSTRWRYPDPKWKFGVVSVGPHGPDPIARVLTFTTPPLAEDTEVIGPIVLELYVASSNIDTDFIVKLADQFPQPEEERKQGRQPASVNVSKGWLRASHREKDETQSRPWRPFYTHRNPQPIEPNRVYKYEIEVLPCAYLFKKGHRIRLEISNADSPLTDSLFVHQYMWYKVGTDTIHHDAQHPSRLILPVRPAAR
jgi:putative CocE/NonD family hydrolase